MTRTPSTQSVLKTLRDACYNMDAIIEQGRGWIEVGFLNEEGVGADYDANESAGFFASEFLGWGGYKTGYGTWILKHGYQRNELIANNID